MKIRFWSPKLKTKRASHRLRGELMASALRALGHDAEAQRGTLDDCDNRTAMIFLKGSTAEHITQAKQAGAVTFYDLCDNKFDEEPEYPACCMAADYITVNTPQMGESVLRNTARTSTVIPDPYERPRLEARFAPQKDVKLLWFGGGSSLKFFPMIEVWQRLEREIKNYHFTMITGKAERVRNKQFQRFQSGVYRDLNFNRLSFYEWDWDLQGQLLADTDIVLMPVNIEHHRTETKSANRLIDSVISGRFVITSPLDSYQEFDAYTWQQDYIQGIHWALDNPEKVIERIQQGQAYTETNYSAQHIAQTWLNNFQSVTGESDVS